MSTAAGKRGVGRPRKATTAAAAAAAGATGAIAAAAPASAPAATPSRSSSSMAAADTVDLTDVASPDFGPDVVMIATPAKRTSSSNRNATGPTTPAGASGASSAAKPLHPFFSIGKKKPPKSEEAKEGAASGAAGASASPLSAASASPTGTSVASRCISLVELDSPLPGPALPLSHSSPPLAPLRCELDTMYATLPKAELFLTQKERVSVRAHKREAEFEAAIARDKAERQRLLDCWKESGKSIHPFLKPKAPMTARERSAIHAAAGGGAKELSPFAHVHFHPDSCAPPFPPSFSHVPLDFEMVASGAPGTAPHVDVEWTAGGWANAGLRLMGHEEARPSIPRPLPPASASQHYTPLRLSELVALPSLTPSSLPASLPMWSRAPSFPPVDYLASPSFRSSDVSSYLAQPRAQAFLRDLVDKLAAHGCSAGAEGQPWTFEQVQKLARRLFIRRVHCYRAMQRDEQLAAQLRKRREADAARESSSGAAPAASSSSSRSDRAAQRGHKTEAAEVAAHGDEVIGHAFQPRPDSLWTEQYRAFRSEEMFGGNVQQRAQVRDWLRAWSMRQEAAAAAPAAAAAATPAKSSGRKKRRYVYHSDDSDFEEAFELYNPPVPAASSDAPAEVSNTLVLVGPPCGKTSLVYACCLESDTGVIEIGSNARRAQRDVLARCEEATQSHRLALVSVAAGSGLNVAASAAKSAFPPSPVKIKRMQSQGGGEKKNSAKQTSPKKAAKAPVGFNFFDAAARKAAATAAAAAPSSSHKSKGASKHVDDDDDDDDDFSLSPKKSVKKKSAGDSASSSVAAPASAPSGKVSKKSLFAMKTKSTLVAIKGMPEELSDDSEESAGGGATSGRKRKATAANVASAAVKPADFFANPAAFTPAKKAKSNASSVPFPSSFPSGGSTSLAAGAAPPSGPSLDPLAPVSQVSSQSTILFEEVDVVFPSLDRKFLAAVRTLVTHAKRPIILTCSHITPEMDEALMLSAAAAQQQAGMGAPLIDTIRFEEPRVQELLPYLFLIAAVEIGFHTVETQARLPALAEIEQLLHFHHNDVRKTLLSMQLALTSTPLTALLGSENMLQAASNPVAAAAALKRSMGQLRLYPSERTCNQDLLLVSLGLLGRKEDLLALFDAQVDESALRALTAPVGRGAAKAPAMSVETASTALQVSHTEALYTSHCQELQLVHLNYLTSLIHSLATPAAAVTTAIGGAADTAMSDSTDGDSCTLAQLPVRLAVLPVTAEEMFPLQDVQLTPEQLAVLPALPTDAAVTQTQPQPQPAAAAAAQVHPQAELAAEAHAPTPMETGNAPTESAHAEIHASPPTVDLPVEHAAAQPADLPAEPVAAQPAEQEATGIHSPDANGAVAMSDLADLAAVVPVEAAAVPAPVDTLLEAASDDNVDAQAKEAEADGEEEEEEEAEVGTRRPRKGRGRRRRKCISVEDEEDGEGAAAPAGSDGDDIDDDDDEATMSVEKLAALQKKRALRQLRDAQRAATREQFVAAEEHRRSQVRAANRQRQRSHPNRALARSISLLDEMSLMASDLSSVDLLTQPSDLYTPRHYSRSHSRFHPSVHPHVSSASRDYYPIYLEAFIPSSNWVSLEQQWADEVEEEAERGDKDKSEEKNKQQMLTISAAAAEKPAPRAVEDVVCSEIEVARDMASVVELQGLRRMRAGARRINLQLVPVAEVQQLAAITTAALPSFDFPAAIPAPSPIAPVQPIVLAASDAIDLTSSPAPPADPGCSPLFLPSADVWADPDPASPLAVQIHRRPASSTPHFRRDMSALAYRIWDNLHWQAHHPPLFQSNEFMLDIFPFVRAHIFSALDSTSGHAAALQAAADAEMAAALAARDGGRATRRSTRASRAEPKLNRRWQLVSDLMVKGCAPDTVRFLQSCAWSDVNNRALHLQTHRTHTAWIAAMHVDACARVCEFWTRLMHNHRSRLRHPPYI